MQMAALREEIAAKQRLRSGFKQMTAFPGMGKMRCIYPAHDVISKGKLLSISQGMCRARRYVVYAQKQRHPRFQKQRHPSLRLVPTPKRAKVGHLAPQTGGTVAPCLPPDIAWSL